MARVRLRTGRDLAVIDIADGGALAEGPRLLPGTHVDVHIVGRNGRVLVRSRVVRAWVSHVDPDAVRYRSALSFDRSVDTSGTGYVVPAAVAGASDAPGSGYPNPAASHDPGLQQPLSSKGVT